MNETDGYDPESFHPSLMHSVHVAVDGDRLCLRHPQGNIPRWASFEEVPHEASLTGARTYRLANSQVSILFFSSSYPRGGKKKTAPGECGIEIQQQGDPFRELFNLSVCLQSDGHSTLR